MQNGKKIAKEFAKIYSFGEGEDSAGGFRLERARKVDFRTL